MAKITRSELIAAPPEVVWAILADFDAISAWAPNVDHSCFTTDREAGIGAARRIQTGRTTVIETVTAWDPDEKLAYRLEGLPPIVRSVTNTWTLEPAGSATRTTLTTQIESGNLPPQRVGAKAIGRVLGKASEAMLGGIKVKAEESA